MPKNKVLMFGLLGAGGCLLGWLVGEGLLLACLPKPSGTADAPSLVTKPELPELAPPKPTATAVPPAPPSPPAPPQAAPPPAPELPTLAIAGQRPLAPPPPEFRERLEREQGQQIGDVRITLLWNNYNDLDLHCIDPRGEEIFYSHKRSASRGELDVDQNVSPETDKPVENIYWPKGGAPEGTYKVYVNHFEHHAERSPSRTPFKINLLVNGRQQDFEGTISHGDPKRLIHTFLIGPTLRLAVPEKVEVQQGGRNRMKIKIARDRFDEAVTVRAMGDLRGVSIPEVTLRPGVIDAEMEILADNAAAEGDRNLSMVASGGGTSVQAPLRVTVHVVPPSLVLAVPTQVEVNQGGSNRLQVLIARFQFDEPVKIVASGAAEGLSVPEVTLPKGETTAELDVFATDEAPGGSQSLQLVATGGGAQAEAPLQVNVKELPAALRLAVPAKVDVNQGASNRMQIQIGRDHFRGPVEATVTGELAGITITPLVLQPGQDKGELDIQADVDARPGNRSLKLLVAGNGVTAEGSVQLAVRELVRASSGWSWGMIPLIGLWTALLAVGLSVAIVGGQNRYLRRPLFNRQQLVFLAVGGVVVGLLAGGLAQTLLMLLTAADFFPRLGFAIGWLLLGGLLGYGLAYFIPNLHGWKASAAGSIGGLAGALVFIGVTISGGDVVGRLFGALLLGLSIGLMVALVELTFRKAWLEVCYGSSETVTVNLGPEPVKVGSDGRACTIYARNAPPVAFRYWLDHGKVLCENMEERTIRQLSANESQQIGAITVTVRAGDQIASTFSSSRSGRPIAPAPPPRKRTARSAPAKPAARPPSTKNVQQTTGHPGTADFKILTPPPPKRKKNE